jgi:hypothetical protein
MAFQNVNAGKMLKANNLEVGGTITGYFIGSMPSTQYEGQHNMFMQVDGERVTVPAVGNLKYLINDGKLTAGLLTRITRTEDKKVKGGKKSSQFTVEQDPEDSISVGGSASPTTAAAPPTSIANKIQSLKAN